MAAHANNTNRPHPLVAKPRQTTERLRNAGQHSARMATPKAESHAKGTTPAHAAKPHETATHAPSDTKATHAKPDEEPNRHIAKRVVIGTATILALLIACYGAGYAYFSSHFVPGTTVDGMDASNLSQDELAAKIDRIAETWSSHVTGNGLDLTLAEGDVGLTADGTLRATAARAEVDPKRWPLELLSPKQIETGTGVSLDDTRLQATMQAAIDTVNATAAQPTDAYVTYDEGMGTFVIRDATIGGVIDATSAIDTVKTSALCLKQSLELGEAQLVKPQLTSDSPELIAARDAANRVLSLEIPLTKGGQELTRVSKDQIARWVSVGEDMQLDVDVDAIDDWANESLSDKVASSDEVHDYDVDSTSVASSIADNLHRCAADTIEIPLAITGERPAESEGARERGRHIDINLSTQYARFYGGDGTVIWRSYLVSGNTSKRHGTPTGEYSILNKATNQTLIGADENHDNKPDYKSHVNYWMPFLGNAYGLHDASWRSRFGGSIYSYAGSHGCINLPREKAAELFDLVNVGDKVNIHW